MRKLGIFVLLIVMGGCVAADDRNLIMNASAVGQGNLREWDTLSDAQRREAHENLVLAFETLDHNINGHDLAPVTSGH